MENNAGITSGYGHRHAHGHDYKHAYKTQRCNRYGMMASELAERPLGHVLGEIETLSRDLGFYEYLFPYGKERGRKQENTSRSNSQKHASDGGQSELPEGHLLQKGEAIPNPVLDGLLAKELGCDADLRQKIVHVAADRETWRLLNRLVAYIETDVSAALDYGRLNEQCDVLAQTIGITSKELGYARTLLASRISPVGHGWTSIYEYRYFLACHAFSDDAFISPDGDHRELLTSRLKHRYQKQLGGQAPELWGLFKRFAAHQLRRYNKGEKPRLPRSPGRLARIFNCTFDLARSLIELLEELPRNPLEDKNGRLANAKRRRSRPIIRKPELRLKWDEQAQRFGASWVPEMMQRIAGLESPATRNYMQAIGIMMQLRRQRMPSREEVESRVRQSNLPLDATTLADLADAFLVATGDAALVRTSASIEGRLHQAPGAVSQTARAECGYSRLKRLRDTYYNLLESIELKPRLVEYVANHQCGHINGDRPDLLKPLTKAEVVRAMGFEPSGGKRDGLSPEKKKRKNKGRLLERYMKNMWIQLPDGRPIALETLIPGPGGVKDTSCNRLAVRTVQGYIEAIICEENEEHPLSDLKISKRLLEQYGVRVARRTVEKYRKAMGIPSSQLRRHGRP